MTSSGPSSQREHDAAEEILRRRSARQNLPDFARYTKPDYQVAAHNRLIAGHLDAVLRGDVRRLIITTPPRHGKTELVCTRFPSRYIGEFPNREIILGTYNLTVGRTRSGAVKDVIETPEYQRLYPHVQIAKGHEAAGLFKTTEGGVVLGSGVGATMTGFGAHLLVIDDYVKNREDADSELIREKTWEWYAGVARYRLMPGGVIVIDATRWHEDDLIGRILEKMGKGGEQFEVLELPAIAEENDALGRKKGDALWPDWYPLEGEGGLYAIRDSSSPREWTAQFQCRPMPEGGLYFKRDELTPYDENELPKRLRHYLTSDFAVSEKQSADFTCHSLWGVARDSDIYLVETWMEQVDTLEAIEIALDMIAEYKPVLWINEKGVIHKAVGPMIRKRMKERQVFCRMEEYARTRDKPTMCRSFQGRTQQGLVRFPTFDPIWPRLERQMLQFPASRHDDFVDTCALIGLHLDQVVKPPKSDRRGVPVARTAVDPFAG